MLADGDGEAAAVPAELAGRAILRWCPRERDDEVTLFSRYRETAAGVQWPHQIRRERNGEKVYEIYSDSVAINKDLTDDLFSVPAGGAKGPEKPRKK